MNRATVILICVLSLGWGGFAFAQAEGTPDATGTPGTPDATGTPGAAEKDPVFEMGFHVGNLLPNQIEGISEIMGLGGARMAVRLNPGSYFEAGFITGNGEGQEWKNIHASIRMDIPVENILALAYVGADNYYYKGSTTGQKLVFGGHAGGGVMAHLTGSVWFRTDMKFAFSPGTSLYFGFGFQWRI